MAAITHQSACFAIRFKHLEGGSRHPKSRPSETTPPRHPDPVSTTPGQQHTLPGQHTTKRHCHPILFPPRQPHMDIPITSFTLPSASSCKGISDAYAKGLHWALYAEVQSGYTATAHAGMSRSASVTMRWPPSACLPTTASVTMRWPPSACLPTTASVTEAR
eukprot:1195670-Prorocentrum_minimum.AAC.5